MIGDWMTNTVFFSDLLPERKKQLWAELSSILTARGIVPHLVSGTRDIWVRDFLPIQIEADQFVQFVYDPGYLCGVDEVRTVPAEVTGLPLRTPATTSPLVLDGGNVVGAGDRAIVTEKVYDENPTVPKEQLREEIRAALGIRELIVIPREPYDPIGHADGVLRFLSDELVLVNAYRACDPGYCRRLDAVLARHSLQTEKIPYRPHSGSTDGIPSAIGNSINFLRLGKLLLLPTYGNLGNPSVFQIMSDLLPDIEIVPIDCTDLAGCGGVLNCCSWTVSLPLSK